MKFIVTLQFGDDGQWVCECSSIPGCITQGGTREEAIRNIQEAISTCLEVRAELGYPLTVETREVEVVL